MNAKEYLERYKDADMKAKELGEEYKIENDLIDAIRSATDIDGLPKGTRLKKETEEKAVRLAEKARKLKIAELDALLERQEVATTIFKVKDPYERKVLFERYINYGQTWEEICVKLHFSWGSVHMKHRFGLESVREILEAQNVV